MTYTAIPDAFIAPDAPGTTLLFTLLRDNPIAITEGAAGAPKIQTAAINDAAVTAAKIGTGAVTETKLGTGAVTNTKLGASAVSSAKVAWTTGASSYTLPQNQTWTVPAGAYMINSGGAGSVSDLQVSLGSGWASTPAGVCMVFSDGTNVRVTDSAGGPHADVPVYYRSLS